MVVKELSGRFQPLMLDMGTYERIRSLSGDKPMAAYMRTLIGSLAEGLPVDTKELRGGLSMVPVKRQLNELSDILLRIDTKLDNTLTWVKDMQKQLIQSSVATGMVIKALEQSGVIPGLMNIIDEQGTPQVEALWQEFRRKQGWTDEDGL